MTSASKNSILAQIRQSKQKHYDASVSLVWEDKDIYKPLEETPLEVFKKELEQVNGEVHIVDKTEEVIRLLQTYQQQNSQTPHFFVKEPQLISLLHTHHIPHTTQEEDMRDMEVAITTCECLIARTGGVVFSTHSPSGRQLMAYPPTHIVLAHSSQMVDYPTDAYHWIRKKYQHQLPSQITIATGPSRTADIEKTLVLGAHGPKELIVIVCKEKSFINFVP